MPPAPRGATISYGPSRSAAVRAILSGTAAIICDGRDSSRQVANRAATSSVYFEYAGPADLRLLRHPPGAAIDKGSWFCAVRRYRVDGLRHLVAPRRDETLEVQRLAGRTAAAVRAPAWLLVRGQGCPSDGRAVIASLDPWSGLIYPFIRFYG